MPPTQSPSLNTIQIEVTGLQTSIKNVIATVNSLQSAVNALQPLAAAVSQLQLAVNSFQSLPAEVSDLQAKVQPLPDAITALQATIQPFVDSFAKFQADEAAPPSAVNCLPAIQAELDMTNFLITCVTDVPTLTALQEQAEFSAGLIARLNAIINPPSSTTTQPVVTPATPIPDPAPAPSPTAWQTSPGTIDAIIDASNIGAALSSQADVFFVNIAAQPQNTQPMFSFTGKGSTRLWITGNLDTDNIVRAPNLDPASGGHAYQDQHANGTYFVVTGVAGFFYAPGGTNDPAGFQIRDSNGQPLT